VTRLPIGPWATSSGVTLQLFTADQAAVPLLRVPIACHDVRNGFQRKCVQESGIVTCQEDPEISFEGDRSDVREKLFRPARMHSIIDLLDNEDRVLWNG